MSSKLALGKVPGTINKILGMAVTPTADGTAGILQTTPGAPSGGIYTTGTPSTATAGTSDGVMLTANPLRKYATITNPSAVDAFLAIGTPAIAGSGIYLKAGGGAYEIAGTGLTTGVVHGITASGSAALAIMEGV